MDSYVFSDFEFKNDIGYSLLRIGLLSISFIVYFVEYLGLSFQTKAVLSGFNL
jgi:hypothetical protein